MPGENDNQVTVELDEKGQPIKEPEKKQEGEKQYVTLEQLEEIRRQLNGLSYIGRKFQEVDATIKRLSSQAPVKPAPVGDVDPDMELLEKDPKAWARKQAREEIQSAFEEQKRLNEQDRLAAESKTRLESAKKHVIDKYPDIMKNDSELATRYTQVINEHPEYLQNDFGPILAMRDMEDELRKDGRLDEFSKKAVDTEIARRTRAEGGSISKGSPNGTPTKKITLTAEQKAVADNLGIKYEKYAAILERNLKSEGVEV